MADIARHFIGCHVTQETSVQNAFDGMASSSSICQALERGAHLTDAERNLRRARARQVHRAAVTSRMIERYGEESRRDAMKKAGAYTRPPSSST